MNTLKIKEAALDDLPQINALLEVSQLPASDIDLNKQLFLVALHDRTVIGTIALEVFGNSALLRSFAVDANFRSQQIGERLYREAVTQSKQKGITHLFLLTTTADKYFDRMNWQRIGRDEVPEAIGATTEFASLCPVSAIVMKLDI
ncbi:arsenic resistance N-acetyltransferase ArsN2 [Paludibacter sp.]|uniref:arsenic resistance N-acetyltransferase ArsN2 n=1 Tax=Paludibacter sp. TaxID=1898105 RepID=UPI00135335C8|nr:arsenic resistance N-acetyltransferase ArsN2 [Paludibacter sp.]MTK53178.1 GNAT family N-acetyltransferase [Paludibacter sp.]